MTQEDRQLVLIDLSARLPYGVICHIRYKTGVPCYGKLTPLDIKWFLNSNIESIKPYLRPMSSMTAAEVGEYISLKEYIVGSDDITYFFETHESIDWLNAHHFDYRGLIEKGLALEAPEGMY